MRVLRVVVYERVSHDEQKKFGFSIKDQRDRLAKYIEENNMVFVEEYVDEGYSASNMKRPDLQRMLKDSKTYDIILFTKLDRFSRNVLDANEMVLQLKRQGISIRAIEEEDIDTSTADGMFMFNLKVSLAQREQEKVSERVKSIFEWKIKHGQPITGSQPLGYMIKKIDGIKRVVKDPDKEELILDLFNHFILHQSITKTRRYINEKYNMTYKHNSYKKILTTGMYTGSYCGNDNYTEAYIPFKKFAQVQKILAKNLKETTHHTYLFSSLIVCPSCGRKLAGYMARSKYAYRCSRAHDTDCTFPTSIRESDVELYLMNHIDQYAKDYIIKAKVKKSVPASKKRIKELKEEMENLNYIFRKKRITQIAYDKDYEELEKELKSLEAVYVKEDTSHLNVFASGNWKAIYNKLSRENKRALLRSAIDEIHIKEDKTIKGVVLM
jgi:DNA invertase Pin-like site-specific DNA recombinase